MLSFTGKKIDVKKLGNTVYTKWDINDIRNVPSTAINLVFLRFNFIDRNLLYKYIKESICK